MKRYDIEKSGIGFKNLLSSPAPVGRILNYIYIAGTNGLYHVNGYRKIDLCNQVGSAWATEFMIGLGIFSLGPEVNGRYKLLLTDNGQRVFNLLKTDNYVCFDENTTKAALDSVKRQMEMSSENLMPTLKEVFTNSYPFLILKQFLDENGYIYDNKTAFKDDLYEAVKLLYDKDPTPYNKESRTPTGGNRVPSLLQLCEFFEMLDDSKGKLAFFKDKFGESNGEDPVYTEEELKTAVEKLDMIITDAENLANKYGEDGTVFVESVVRNSELQRIFKNNLIVSQHGKCVICGLAIKEMLIGSHIKPAAKSTAAEKADFNNGLLLCCNHDGLFDRHLITFNCESGKIEVSKTITEDDIEKLGIDLSYKLPDELLVPERKQYLAEHNNTFNKKEKSR